MIKALLHAVCVLCLMAVFCSVGCQPGNSSEKNRTDPNAQALVVSISTDGRYVLSSNQDKTLVLWDLQQKSKTTISSQSNIYSAYFIKGTDKFLWQDLNDEVHVQEVSGKTITTFPHFPTYGHVMDQNLQTYFSSDQDWNIFSGFGQKLQPVKQDGDSPSFFVGKLLNFSLSQEGAILLSGGDGSRLADNEPIEKFPPINPEQRFSNYAGVVLWDTKSLKPLFKLSGHSAKTTATLSPDGQWVVSGDEGGRGYVRNARIGETYQDIASIFLGVLDKNGTDDYEKWTFNNKGLIKWPKGWDTHHDSILALKFISKSHYLRFTTYEPYAILYHVDNPLPLKYLPLGRDPFPSVSDYPRNSSIDTAPEAGILVTGQRDGGGIIVYKYDSEKQELEKIWTGN
ncbi:MAG: hypothetical protein RBR06_07375 [Desulfuromonadaceae bacterium]|nr:hypothetical protein [Desulfuromonadaceae bacterium]